jgi:menaquinone-9 beta-reductase
MSLAIQNFAVHNIAIIGAGPAGSLAAITLARAGFNVTLIEQKQFPRDKVCGECVSALGLATLQAHGLLDRLQSAGLQPLTRGQIHGRRDTSLALDLPQPMGGITRKVMDQILLDAAIEAGATVRQPARFENGQLRDLVTNQVEPLRVDLVIRADGKPHSAAKPTGQFGIKTHFTHVQLDPAAIHLFHRRHNYGGVARVEGHLWNAAFVVNQDHLKHAGGNVAKVWERIVEATPSLKQAIKHATQTGDWLTCPLPRYAVESRWRANEIPVGNAAAALEPVGGEGMGLALASSAIACGEIILARSEEREIDINFIRQKYRSLWRVRRIACRASSLLLSKPAVVDTALRVIKSIPSLRSTLLYTVGKTSARPAVQT